VAAGPARSQLRCLGLGGRKPRLGISRRCVAASTARPR